MPEMPAPPLQPTRLALGAHLPAVAPPADGTEATAPTENVLPQPPEDGAALHELAQEQYSLDVSAAATLGFSVVSLKGDDEHKVLVYQVARYKDLTDTHGATYRFGIAVEATIVATVAHFEGGLTLPTVAANVQLGYSNASSDLAVRGYAFTPQLSVTLPAWGSFDVGAYADFQKSVDAIVSKVLFDNGNIKPVLLATTTAPIDSPEITPPHKRHWWQRPSGS
jgi:hypothetical protein